MHIRACHLNLIKSAVDLNGMIHGARRLYVFISTFGNGTSLWEGSTKRSKGYESLNLGWLVVKQSFPYWGHPDFHSNFSFMWAHLATSVISCSFLLVMFIKLNYVCSPSKQLWITWRKIPPSHIQWNRQQQKRLRKHAGKHSMECSFKRPSKPWPIHWYGLYGCSCVSRDGILRMNWL